jgi:phospholipid/cholesterol/gamma-HCH transport system ATP-binding protein
VLDGIDFSIEQGGSMVILGGSGTGKSVLIKCIIGLLEPDAGSFIAIDDKDITFMPIFKRAEVMKKFGVLFQGGALFDSLTVWENVSFYLLQNDKFTKRQAFDLAVSKLEQVGLKADDAYLYPVELSGGMQKRVALARAIANDPEIIFFDEPTAGLDPIMSAVITDLIAHSSRELGATTITITHDIPCAKKISTNIAMLQKGKFIWQGDAHALENSGNEYVDCFIHGKVMKAA